MKAILVAAVVVLGMCLVGWLTISDSAGQTTITIEKQEIREDTKQAVEKGKELIDDAGKKLQEEKQEETPEDRESQN